MGTRKRWSYESDEDDDLSRARPSKICRRDYSDSDEDEGEECTSHYYVEQEESCGSNSDIIEVYQRRRRPCADEYEEEEEEEDDECEIYYSTTDDKEEEEEKCETGDENACVDAYERPRRPCADDYSTDEEEEEEECCEIGDEEEDEKSCDEGPYWDHWSGKYTYDNEIYCPEGWFIGLRK